MKTRILSALAIAGFSPLTFAHGDSAAANSLYHAFTSPDHLMMILLLVVGGGLILSQFAQRARRQKID